MEATAGRSTTTVASARARRSRARILDLSRRARADHTFLAEVSHELQAIVPFKAAFWAASDPVTTLATSPSRVENLASEEACVAFWDTEFLAEDFIRFRDLARARQPSASLFRATADRPARSVRYRTFNRIFGYGDELRAVFRAEGSAWGLVSLWREGSEPPFSATEERLVADLSAPIAEAFRRTTLIGSRGEDDALDGPGLLTFDEGGVLESLNEQAEMWLRHLDTKATDEKVSVETLPTAILNVAAQARAIAAGLESGAARARIRSESGRWFVIHGFGLRGAASGHGGRTALVIEPARASHVAPILVDAYQLTNRELQITELVSAGLSTRAIATRLHLSPHTVRDYLKQVFEKVGVSSRGELVAKIFADHYEKPLSDGLIHATRERTS